MSDNNIKEISIDKILKSIHEEVESKKRDGFSIPVYSKKFQDILLNFDRFDIEKRFNYKESYELNDFLQFHNEEFIIYAYRGILGREPDAAGLRHYLDLYKTGRLDKITILGRLLYSAEAKKKNIKINGLFIPYILSELYQIKFIGYFIRLITAILTLPVLIKNLSELERHTLFQTEDIKRKHNNLLDNLEVNITNLEFNKADYSVVEFKADKGYLDEQLQLKADKSELELKADKKEVELKADKLYVDSKANKEELKLKADRNEFNLYLKTIDYASQYIKLAQKDLTSLIQEAKKRLPQTLTPEEIKRITEAESDFYDSIYAAFEDNFRGSRELIRSRLMVYIPYIEKLSSDKESLNILDIGSGRGEWLQLLKELGYSPKGLDINRIFVEYCKNAGLDVNEGNALNYLQSLPDNSVSVITGFHIVEHLELKELIMLFDEIKRVLKQEGMVIFETPNPENIIVGSCNFYLDPTHRNPIPPETLKFLVKYSGFIDIDVLRLNDANFVPAADDNEDIRHIAFKFNMSQDYAVIGYKN